MDATKASPTRNTIMTNSLKRLVLSTIVAVVASGSAPFSGTAVAATLPDGNGGALCKGADFCDKLKQACKGKYTDATQTDGTVYGKCTQTTQTAPGVRAKLRAN
jgi:hypothetical protein